MRLGSRRRTTRVTDLSDGVVVTVRAPRDPVARQQIRRRVQYRLEIADQPERGAIEPTGMSGSTNVRCAIVTRTDDSDARVRDEGWVAIPR